MGEPHSYLLDSLMAIGAGQHFVDYCLTASTVWPHLFTLAAVHFSPSSTLLQALIKLNHIHSTTA